MRQEDAGPVCSYGGSRVRSGIDANRNGVLEDAEVAHEAIVCNGAPPPSPEAPAVEPVAPVVHRVISATDAVAPGAECRVGGHVVRSGTDANDDGELALEETESRTVLCDHATLTNTLHPPVLAECAAGGVRVESGIDRDDDGVLDEDEVATREVVCGTVVEGDLMLASPDDVERAKDVVAVTGNVLVGPVSRAVRLPALRIANGGIVVDSGSVTAAIDLPALQWTGDVSCVDNEVLEEVHLGALAGMGNLRASNCAKLGVIELSALERGKDVELTNVPMLTSFALPKVVTLGRLLLQDAGPVQLEVAAGHLDGISFYGVAVRDARFPNLQTLPWGLAIWGAPLEGLDLPYLEYTRAVSIRNVHELRTLRIPIISHLESLHLEEVEKLETLELWLRAVDNEVVVHNVSKLASLRGLSTLRSCRAFELVAPSPEVTNLDELHLEEVDTFLVYQAAGLVRADLPRLERVGVWVFFEENPALTRIRLPSLRGPFWSLESVGAPLLTSLQAPLAKMTQVSIWGSPLLPTCDVQRLREQTQPAAVLYSDGTDDTAACSLLE